MKELKELDVEERVKQLPPSPPPLLLRPNDDDIIMSLRIK
jgi:hypothetical protein